MATAQTIINRSLRLLGQVAAGEDPTADETADALVSLNAIMDSMRNDKLVCYAHQDETLTLSDGDGSYTVGPSGDLTTTRPVGIAEAYIVDADVGYPVRILNEAEWAAIPDKTVESDWPDSLLFRATMPNATVLVYPVPNATRTLRLVTRVVWSTFAAATDTVTLPPGWEEYLANALAISIAPEYETQPAPTVVAAAAKALAGIKRTNQRPAYLGSELGVLLGTQSHNILTDAP